MIRCRLILPVCFLSVCLPVRLSAAERETVSVISEDEIEIEDFAADASVFQKDVSVPAEKDSDSAEADFGLPWRLSWSLNFEGTLKFTDNSIGFNPLFLYNDKMLNRNTFRMNLTLMPSDLYSAIVYTYLNVHLRNIYDEENPEEGDFLYRNRYGIGWDSRFSFMNDLDFLLGLEYRLDQSNWNSFKHRLSFRALLEGSGIPGLSWSVEQKILPFFSSKANGLSSFETETLLNAGYEFFRAGSKAKAAGYSLTLYNDFYLDTTSYPDGSETEYYLEETIGLKAGLTEFVRLIFGPTYFFHNLPPYKNVSLLGFKAGSVFSFKTKPIIAEGETLRAARTYTLSAYYWGAHNFDRSTWDHLIQIAFGVSYPGVTQKTKR